MNIFGRSETMTEIRYRRHVFNPVDLGGIDSGNSSQASILRVRMNKKKGYGIKT